MSLQWFMPHILVSNIQLYFDTLLISWMQNQGQQAGGYHPAAIARDIGAIEARVIGLKVPIAKIKNDSRKNHNSKHKAAINK